MKKALIILATILCLCSFVNLHAQTHYWFGGSSTYWHTAANWSSTTGSFTATTVPGSGDDVEIGSDAITFCKLDAHASANHIDIVDGGELDAAGYNLTLSGNLTLNSDEVLCGSGSITVAGSVYISGGTFESTSGTLSIGEGITDEMNAFAHNNGTAQFTDDGTFDVPNPFYDVVVDNGVTVQVDQVLWITNSLELNGQLTNPGNTVVLQATDPAALTGSGGMLPSFDESGNLGAFVWGIEETDDEEYVFPLIARTGEGVTRVEVYVETPGTGTGFLGITTLGVDDTKPVDMLPGTQFLKADGTSNVDYNLNRVWGVATFQYISLPVVTLEFYYNAADLDGISVTEANLKAQFFDPATGRWSEPMGTVDTGNDKVTVVGQPTTTGFWVLVDETSPNYTSYNGKTGLSCDSPIELDSLFKYTVYEFLDSVIWIKFMASDTTMYLDLLTYDLVDSLNFQIAKIHSSCATHVNNVDVIQNRANNHFILENLTPDSIYLIKVVRSTILKKKFLIHHNLPDHCRYTPDGNVFVNLGDCGFENYYGLSDFLGEDPDNYVPVKYLRVVVHVFNKTNGTPITNGFNTLVQNYVNDMNNLLEYMPAPIPDPTDPDERVHLGDSRLRIRLVDAFLWNDDLGYDPSSITCSGLNGAHCAAYISQMTNTYVTNNLLYTGPSDSVIHIFMALGDNPGNGNGPRNLEGVAVAGWFPSALTIHELGHMFNLWHIESDQLVYSPGGGFLQIGCSNNFMDYNNNNFCPWMGGLRMQSFAQAQLIAIHNDLDIGGGYNRMVDFPCQIDPIESELVLNTGNTITWNTNKIIDRNIRIISGTTLKITCLLGMPEDGVIIVEKGAKLIVDGGQITNVCGARWTGIEVWGHESQPQPALADCETISSGNQGIVCLKNGAMLENAKIAVTLKKRGYDYNGPTYHNGGVIIADNVTFRNNGKSIEFMKYLDRTAGRDGNVSYIRDCIFETDGPLNGGINPDAHVTLWAVYGVEFTGNLFINRTPELYDADKRGEGIRSIDATYKIVPGCLLMGNEYGCLNNFEGLYIGINVEGNRSSNTFYSGAINISHNIFNGCQTGIQLNGSTYTRIFSNEFNFSENSLIGIYNLANKYHVISENVFDMEDAPYSRGIYNLLSITPHQQYKNTFLEGASESVAFANTNYAFNVTFKCNDVQDGMAHYDVYSGNIARLQGGPFDPAGNYFDLDCDNYYDSHFWFNSGVLAQWGTVDYWYSITSTQEEPDLFCVNTPSGLNKRLASSTSNCPIRYGQGGGGGGGFAGKMMENDSLKNVRDSLYVFLDGGTTYGLIDTIRNLSIHDTVVRNAFNSKASMVSDKAFMELILHRPTFDRTELSMLFLQNYPLSFDLMYVIENLDASIPGDSLDKLYTLQNDSTYRKTITEAIAAIEYERFLNWQYLLYLVEQDTNLSYTDWADTLKKETDPWLLLMLADYYVADSQYSKAWDIYDTVPQYNQELTQWVALRQVDLTFEEQEWDYTWLDSTGESGGFEDDIRDIASTNTSAGYQAKNILKLTFGESYTLPWEERDGSSKRIVDKSAEDDILESISNPFWISVYPNPASNSFTFQYIWDQDEPLNLLIYDMLGNVLIQNKLFKGTDKIDINVSNLTNGTYIYFVSGPKLNQKTGKFVILR